MQFLQLFTSLALNHQNFGNINFSDANIIRSVLECKCQHVPFLLVEAPSGDDTYLAGPPLGPVGSRVASIRIGF
jgi:hypothetical protein